MYAQSIFAGIRSFLDEAGHCISDNDRQGAINNLTDCLEAIRTLQGHLKLPSGCCEDIWQ